MDRVFIWIERVLFGLGLAALAWCVLVLGEAHAIQWTARHAVDHPRLQHSAHSTSQDMFVPLGKPLARLQVSRIGLSAVVLEGDDDRTLRVGPGHIRGTAIPGGRGNVAIAGHRDTFFRSLRHIRIGDEITLTGPAGQFRYQVSSLRVVKPDDVSVLDPTQRPMLTLITCYPFSLLGHAPDRFIVRARLIDANGARSRAG